WGTAPAMAGWVIAELTGIKFSMEAHAYDIYENGGDIFLKEKMTDAQFVRTSTEVGCKDLFHLCKENKVYLIRRGLGELTPIKPMRTSRNPLRVLSVGRLVEKKGFFRQVELLTILKQKEFPFEAKIIGKGPLYRPLKKKIQALGLEESIQLETWKNPAEIKALYQWADVMVFTGKVAKNGDRDGLPNVIAEAMGEGLPVISSNVSGSSEAIIHGKTGLLINAYAMDGEWIDAFKQLASDDVLYRNIQHNARKWIEANFDLEKNMQLMCDLLVS
ncbi:MAG: glycosyltransferase, partial [Chlamydiales bacterium]